MATATRTPQIKNLTSRAKENKRAARATLTYEQVRAVICKTTTWNYHFYILGPVYMEKSCPGQEGHPPTRVNFTERLYEKKVDPSARAKS